MKLKIETLNKEIEITRLPLKKYAELLKGIENLPKHLTGFDKLTNEEIFVKIPGIISDALPDVIHVLNVATGLAAEEIETLGLDEVTDLFVAVMQENKYTEVYSKLKKGLAQPTETPIQ